MQNRQGFTLIELMIVVAIMGILSMFAMSSYQDYIIRSRLSKVPTAIEPIKLAIAEYGALNGQFNFTPNDWQSPQASQGLGLTNVPLATNEIASYALAADGTITLTLQNIGTCANNKTLTWRPTLGGTVVIWTIGGSAVGGANTCGNEVAKWQ